MFPAYSAHDINHTITNIMLRKELSEHKHQMSRTGKSAKDMRKELLEHYFFIHQNFDESVSNITIQKVICYCHTEENSKTDEIETMIRCDLEDCENEWFHLKCLDQEGVSYPLPDEIETGNNIYIIYENKSSV